MAEVKLVIFDMDGLIFNSERLYLNCAMHISEKYGYGITPELIRRTMGKNSIAIQKMIKEEMGENFPLEEYWHNVSTYEHHFKETHYPEFMKGFPELLSFLKENGIYTAVATSTRREVAVPYIRRSGIFDRMEYIICGDDLTESKPKPQIYLKVLDYYKMPADNALVFEDSANGLLSSYNAGIRCILVPDIAIVPDDVREKAYKIIESLDLAIDIIKKENTL